MEINETLWEIARAIADADTTYRDDFSDQYCVFCNGEENFTDAPFFPFHHEATCPVIKARVIIEQAKLKERLS
jgi:hypothetical protein